MTEPARVELTPWPPDPLPFPEQDYRPPRPRYDPRVKGFLLEAPGLGVVDPKYYGREEPLWNMLYMGRGVDRFQEPLLLTVTDWGEHYLELVELNLDSNEEIVEFIERYGILGMRFNNRMGGPNYLHEQGFISPIGMSAFEEQWADEIYEGMSPVERLEADPEQLERSGIRQWLRSLGVVTRLGQDAANLVLAETLQDFRIGARQLRDLVRAWRVVSGELALADVQDSWETPGLWSDSQDFRDITGDDPGTLEGLAGFLRHSLSDGSRPALAPFRPRLLGPGQEEPFGGTLMPPLFNMLCLELFNHISEGLPYKTCAGCGMLFVRQRGYAAHRKHRTSGIRFHSEKCGDAYHSRRYRQRQAKAARAG